MQHLGEILALTTAVLWTISTLFTDKAIQRMGSMSANVIRLVMATVMLALILWVGIGSPYPVYADWEVWIWLGASAVIGYVFGDWCLFNCYVSIGARLGQLFMTLAPPIAAIAGWLILGEKLSWKSGLAMVVTLSGIAISILSRGEGNRQVRLSIPLKGVLLGLGASIGQGVGLVFSKVGMEHYAGLVPADAPAAMETLLPFASTMIRAIFGTVGFIVLMLLGRKTTELRRAVRDRKGMSYAVLMTLLGPVVGVSLSLMAVRYTSAGIASTLIGLTPVFILIPYAFIYHQKIRAREVLGVFVSMTGVALFFLL